VSESAQEYEMFTRGRGEMFNWLRRNERDMSDCGLGSPIRHLERCGGLHEGLLAVHANYLARDDAALLAKRKVSVVHCPRSHSYFSHGPFPYERLARAGVNVCLGTDSLATVLRRRREEVQLSVFDEMRAFARANPRVPASRILRLATQHGASALGLAGKIGELSPGALADLIAIPFRGKKSDATTAAVAHAGEVSASMIDGEWAIPPERG
jgi:cytosine/adenosine deaminase-related metal-dependent hydrolase